MTQEPILEPSPTGVPRPRRHRHEEEGENKQGKDLGQESKPVGTSEEEQPQQCQQKVDFAERNRAAASPSSVLSEGV